MRAASAFPFLSFMFSLSAFGLEDGVLSRADFDRFMTIATDRNGAVEACDGITKDLQLRMHPGMDDKGNSLTLGTEEWVSWPLKGHVRPDRGTVSFWVKPCNYTIGSSSGSSTARTVGNEALLARRNVRFFRDGNSVKVEVSRKGLAIIVQ